MRRLTEEDVEFAIRCEPEDIPFVGNCSAIDEETDRENEEWIRDQLDCGNEWAWCYVVVTAEWSGFTGKVSLGGCSYLSESEFCRGGYFDDLKAEALEALNNELERVGTALATLQS